MLLVKTSKFSASGEARIIAIEKDYMKSYFIVAALLLTAPISQAAPASQLPNQIGKCVLTTVKSVSQRLEDGRGNSVPDSGSAISFKNGGYQVDYDQVPAVNNSRPGDQVVMCLVELPTDCPPGDERGKTYTTTNLRTLEFWSLADAENMCGGA